MHVEEPKYSGEVLTGALVGSAYDIVNIILITIMTVCHFAAFKCIDRAQYFIRPHSVMLSLEF
jgi:hypothetical protein